jgi:hypothetical protein
MQASSNLRERPSGSTTPPSNRVPDAGPNSCHDGSWGLRSPRQVQKTAVLPSFLNELAAEQLAPVPTATDAAILS